MVNYYEFSSGDFSYKYINLKTCSVGNGSFVPGNGAVNGTSCIGTAVIPSKVYDSDHGLFLIVTQLSRYCFRDCVNLTAVSLPNSLTSIYHDSFFHTSIETLIIPSSVVELNYAAFSGMGKLKEIIIRPGSLKKLEDCVFANPSKLIKIVIPPTVTSIGAELFRYHRDSSIDFIYCGSHALLNEKMFMANGNVSAFVTNSYPPDTNLGDLVPYVLPDNDNTCSPYMFHYS